MRLWDRFRIRAQELWRDYEDMNKPTAGARPRKPPAPRTVVALTMDDPVVHHLDRLIHDLNHKVCDLMATTKERLTAVGGKLDEVRSDIAELKAKVAAGQVQPEDFEAELAAIESKVGAAADDYTADPATGGGGGEVDADGNPVQP